MAPNLTISTKPLADNAQRLTPSEQVRSKSTAQPQNLNASLTQSAHSLDAGISKCSHPLEINNTSLKEAIANVDCKDLPTHKILAAPLGKNQPLVVIDGSRQVPVVNLDRLTGDKDTALTKTLTNQIIRAICICDINQNTHQISSDCHPLFQSSMRKLPSPLYFLARHSSWCAQFAGRYYSQLKRCEKEDGIMKSLYNHGKSFAHALSTSLGTNIPSRDLPELRPPRHVNPVKAEKYLLGLNDFRFQNQEPEKVIAHSFGSALTRHLKSAIDKTTQACGLPEYKSPDPWNVMTAVDFHKMSSLHKQLLNNFKIAGFVVRDWITESRSSFFRYTADRFWNHFDEKMSVLAGRVLSRGDNTLRITIAGVGMNEQALSTAMAMERFLDKNNLRNTLNYEITVLSRDNPTMRALSNAKRKGLDFPIIYPKDSMPDNLRSWQEFFEPARGGYVPTSTLTDRIRYVIGDLTDGVPRKALGPPADLAVIHNVITYIPEGKRINALHTIDKLTREDGLISLSGDKGLIGYDLEQARLLQYIERNGRRYNGV